MISDNFLQLLTSKYVTIEATVMNGIDYCHQFTGVSIELSHHINWIVLMGGVLGVSFICYVTCSAVTHTVCYLLYEAGYVIIVIDVVLMSIIVCTLKWY